MFTEQVAFQGGHISVEELSRPPVIAKRQVGAAQVLLRAHLEGEIPEGRGKGKCVLAGRDGMVIVPEGVQCCTI